jgi:2-polyprenyl-6-methoxyphenol hydroxylase-like FAD-dependent oxidoreductase
MSTLLVSELRRLAGRLWPAPWSRTIQTAIAQCRLFATPVAEYVPLRMVRDQVVIVGDAAHVASPMVGAGFRSGLLDVETLAQCLKDAAPGDVVRALKITQSQRIADARRMVRSGMGYGPDLLADSDEPVGDTSALPSVP